MNQAARLRPHDVKALVKAGTALRKAQRGAISGGGPSALREATSTHRGLVEELTDSAREALEARGGVSPSVLSRIAQTLRSASVDNEAAKRLTAGTLESDVEQTGFGPLLSVVPKRSASARPAAKPEAKASAKPKPDPKVARLGKLREQLAQARRDARREGREADLSKRRAEQAEERVRLLEGKIERLSS